MMTIENLMLACVNLSTKTTFNVYHRGTLLYSSEYYGLPVGIRDKHTVFMFKINENGSCDIILA